MLAPRTRTHIRTYSVITAVILSNSEANINYIRDNDTAHQNPQVIDKYFMKQARQLQPSLLAEFVTNWNCPWLVIGTDIHVQRARRMSTAVGN